MYVWLQQTQINMPIEQKHQLIDDEAVFKIQELQGLNKKHIQALNKHYHVLSIIGSQSSGKSTLLNALFGTSFEELNRATRVGQTTKGIWYSVDPKNSMMILDVEGSDSHEREERTKFQRRNSLFALAVSHTLLINLWIQQIGLYRGSQLSILEIILELNLRLFGSQQPKNIIFVVRDFEKNHENVEGLKAKLFSKVEQTWNAMKKPPGKQNIQLTDLFKLQAFFLPSKVQDPEQFQQEVGLLRNHLFKIASNQKIINKNVAMSDVPQFMKNLWETITNDKDVNLPQQKILLSNMKCQQVKKQVYAAHQNEFRDQLQISQRKMNVDFAINIKKIVKKMLDQYDQQVVNYHPEESKKVRQELEADLERKIQLSYSYQVKLISSECVRQFTDQVNRLFLKQKQIQKINSLRPQYQHKFADLIHRVSFRQSWARVEIQKFDKALDESFESLKQRIVVDSLKDLDRTIKGKVQKNVSKAFCDKKIYEQNFWDFLNSSFKQLDFQIKNAIIALYKKLQYKPDTKNSGSVNKTINDHVERARSNGLEQLKTELKMKCNDLFQISINHFSNQFNIDASNIPRNWVNMKPEQITKLYQQIKQKYINLTSNFTEYELKFDGNDRNEQSMTASKKGFRSTISTTSYSNSKQLMNIVELANLNKKLGQAMEAKHQEALKKNKQVYVGAIPKWAWILFLIVAFDDIILWLASPALAIPLTIILIAIGGVFFFGGPSFANSLVTNARRAATASFGQLAAQATTKIIKNS